MPDSPAADSGAAHCLNCQAVLTGQWGDLGLPPRRSSFIVQALTGGILAMYYEPSASIDPVTGKPVAYSTIESITWAVMMVSMMAAGGTSDRDSLNCMQW